MKILVTGSTGFVGQKLCQDLVSQSYQVKASYRNRAPLNLDVNAVLIDSLDSQTDWSEALDDVEAVVHLAARVHVMNDSAADPLEEFRKVNVLGTVALAEQAAEQGVKRFVFISSIKVNGESTREAPFSEEIQQAPQDPYGLSKWEAEIALREIEAKSNMEVVIIRPPLIYGPHVKANFLKLVKAVDKGVPLPFGCIKNSRSLIGLSNFVDLIIHCIKRSEAARQTFLASDGDDVSTPELVRRIADSLDRKARLLPVPQFVMHIAGYCTGKSAEVQRLCSSLQIDSTKLQTVLKWQPPFSMAEELAKLVKEFKGST